MKTRRLVAVAVLGLSLGLAGCELAALFAGHGSQPALYQFGKNQRVLVLVDVLDGVTLPPGFDIGLAEGIGQHLYSYKAADHIVAQERLLQVRERNPDVFKKMGMADVAVATDADVVLHVRILRFITPVISDGTVAQGDAEVFVKVVDRTGARLFPGDPTGVRVIAHQDPSLISDRSVPMTQTLMMAQLAMRTGRMFHKYSLEDRVLTK